jgi:gliding motility-associated-like protein
LTLTQGFQQPVGGGNSVLSVSVLSTDLSCAGANDGTAKAIIHTGAAPYQFSWSTSPPQITEVAVGLKPGTYYVTTTDANQFSVTDSVVVKDNRSICGIHVYSGFSPNGDGKNDLWVIDYIDLFKPNTVLIYNRWGELVWDADNYDNTTVVWNGTDKKSGTKLPDGTYFYVIRIGAQEQRNWVEITR